LVEKVKLALRTIESYRGRLRFWKTYFGKRPIYEITLKELADIQNWLTRLPVNYLNIGLSVQEAVTMAQDQSSVHAAMSDKTRAEYLTQLRGVFEYSYNSGFIQKDLSSNIEIPNTKASVTINRLPFDSDDLKLIFQGSRYGRDFGMQRSDLDYDVKFWLPLLAAFTGARLEELGQLKISDIITCPDTKIIYANISNSGKAADGTAKHLKNLNSNRPIPIHSTLINIGFLNYIEKRKKDKKDTGLFKLIRNNQGQLTKGVSKWFSRLEKRKAGGFVKGYIERCGVVSKGNDDDKRWSKSFHSFRHTFIDNLRGAKMENNEYIREQDIGLVVGHEKDKLETANYGGDRSQLPLRKAVVEAIHYPDVAFNEIRWR